MKNRQWFSWTPYGSWNQTTLLFCVQSLFVDYHKIINSTQKIRQWSPNSKFLCFCWQYHYSLIPSTTYKSVFLFPMRGFNLYCYSDGLICIKKYFRYNTKITKFNHWNQFSDFNRYLKIPWPTLYSSFF